MRAAKGKRRRWKQMLPLLLAVVCMSEGCGGRTEENGQTEILENSVSEAAQDSGGEERMDAGKKSTAGDYTLDTTASEVMGNPVFEDYGRLIFPANVNIDADLKLKDVSSILTWYSNVKPERTVEIVNYMKEQASGGRQIFYDIYTEEEK